MGHIWDSREQDSFYHLGEDPPEPQKREARINRYDLKMVREIEHTMGTAAICHHAVVDAVPVDDGLPLFSSVRCGVLQKSHDLLLRCCDLYRRSTSSYGELVRRAELDALKRETEDFQHWVEVCGERIGNCVSGKCACPDRRALGGE